MPLKSFLFEGNTRLEHCLTTDPAHVVPGDVGSHVRDIQTALEFIDRLVIVESEKLAQRYGPSTAAAVLAYKKKRKIINHSYQSSEDNIVGKMTMAALDKDMLDRQTTPAPFRWTPCWEYGRPRIPGAEEPPASPVLTAAMEQALKNPGGRVA